MQQVPDVAPAAVTEAAVGVTPGRWPRLIGSLRRTSRQRSVARLQARAVIAACQAATQSAVAVEVNHDGFAELLTVSIRPNETESSAAQRGHRV